MSLANVEASDYMKALEKIGLNPKKAAKVYAKAMEKKPRGELTLSGKTFAAEEILNAKYANSALYCLDVDESIEIIENLGSNNAQGEIYLTDAIEKFAAKNSAAIYEISNKTDMLTYSTKSELRKISRYFMRYASEFVKGIEDGEFDSYFTSLYRDKASEHKER